MRTVSPNRAAPPLLPAPLRASIPRARRRGIPAGAPARGTHQPRRPGPARRPTQRTAIRRVSLRGGSREWREAAPRELLWERRAAAGLGESPAGQREGCKGGVCGGAARFPPPRSPAVILDRAVAAEGARSRRFRPVFL